MATDVAARGIDIVHIERVINYDLPQAPEDYIHRIGRSARGDAKGEAVNFITEEDKIKWQNIQNFIAGKKTLPESRSRFRGGKKDGFWSKSRRSDSEQSAQSKRNTWSKSRRSDGEQSSQPKRNTWSKSKRSDGTKNTQSHKKTWSKNKSSAKKTAKKSKSFKKQIA